MRNFLLFLTVAIATPISTLFSDDASPRWDTLEHYNVQWMTPSQDSGGSMPIGNGDIGLNIWVEKNGDVLFYISKTDSWSENGRLLKLGRVRLSLSPNPFENTTVFDQTLKLNEGEITIDGGPGNQTTSLRLWVDANQPVVRIEIQSDQPQTATCRLELWRTQQRTITGLEADNGVRAMSGDDFEIIEYPDTLLPSQNNRIRWYHRNDMSVYPIVLKNQHLEDFLCEQPDPLLNRTFGGCMLGDHLTAIDDKTLVNAKPVTKQIVEIHLLTAQTDTAQQWLDQLNRQIHRVQAIPLDQARDTHRRWWRQFWQRSWIFIEGDDHAYDMTRSYVLQRFINACGGRGQYPIKFNGSIFTVDARQDHKNPDRREFLNADYRRWGSCYWFQNTRLPYWAMIASGDIDLTVPLFDMYKNALPLARFQTQTYFNHNGAFFPETMHFWGSYCNVDFGWNNPERIAKNHYIRYYWSGGIELISMMLDVYDSTRDDSFARNTMLPLTDAILTFFDLHWRRDGSGKILFSPAASLETWHEATNPLPEIAGLNYVLKRLGQLPESLVDSDHSNRWKRMLTELPALPMAEDNGTQYLLPAEKFGERHNIENPELYAVFPYRLFGIGKPDIAIALETWNRRREKRFGGWQQNAIQAACLGLADPAAEYVIYNATHKNKNSRFPAFWGPNYDWIPDQCHGNVTMIALQNMLMQCQNNKIILLPAWPKYWNVKFKLHAFNRTTVEGVYLNGKMESLNISPANRKSDVEILTPQ